MLLRIVQLTLQPGTEAAFRAAFDESKAAIRAMAGCHGLALHTDADRPAVVYTVSRWANADALEAYRQSEVFQRTWARVKPLFGGRPQAFSLLEADVVAPTEGALP